MSLSLSSALAEKINELVKAGPYDSAEAVVGEALRLLEQRDELRSQQLQELRSEIDLGLDDLASGRSSPLDREAIRAKVNERLGKTRSSLVPTLCVGTLPGRSAAPPDPGDAERRQSIPTQSVGTRKKRLHGSP